MFGSWLSAAIKICDASTIYSCSPGCPFSGCYAHENTTLLTHDMSQQSSVVGVHVQGFLRGRCADACRRYAQEVVMFLT